MTDTTKARKALRDAIAGSDPDDHYATHLPKRHLVAVLDELDRLTPSPTPAGDAVTECPTHGTTGCSWTCASAAAPDTRPALDEATGALVPVIQAVLDAHRPSEHGFCVTCGVQFYPTHQAERIAAALTERNNR